MKKYNLDIFNYSLRKMLAGLAWIFFAATTIQAQSLGCNGVFASSIDIVSHATYLDCSWPSGGQDVTHYIVTISGGHLNTPRVASTPFTSFSIGFLEPCETYSVSVDAVCPQGTVNGLGRSASTSCCGAVQTSSVYTGVDGDVTIRFTPPGGNTLVQILIGNTIVASGDAGMGNSHTFTNLNFCTEYRYRFRTVCPVRAEPFFSGYSNFTSYCGSDDQQPNAGGSTDSDDLDDFLGGITVLPLGDGVSIDMGIFDQEPGSGALLFGHDGSLLRSVNIESGGTVELTNAELCEIHSFALGLPLSSSNQAFLASLLVNLNINCNNSNKQEELTFVPAFQMDLFPNPAVEQANLRLADPVGGRAVISLMDLQGRNLIEMDIDLAEGQTLDIPLPIAELAKGLYLVQVRSATGQQVRRLTIE